MSNRNNNGTASLFRPTHTQESADHLAGAENDSLYDGRIKLHPACLMYPRLSDQALAALEQDMLLGDDIVNLRQKIVIDAEGKIVDGRHRAIVLINNGYGDDLCGQIQTCLKSIDSGGYFKSDWVSCLPDDAEPFEVARRLQTGRRNLPDYLVARNLLAQYQEAVASSPKGRRRQSETHRSVTSPVDVFCKKCDIDKRTFQMAQKIEQFAPELWVPIEQGELAFAKAYQDAARRDKSKASKRRLAGQPKAHKSKEQLPLFDAMDQPFTMRDLLDDIQRQHFCDLALKVLPAEALADLAILELALEANAEANGLEECVAS